MVREAQQVTGRTELAPQRRGADQQRQSVGRAAGGDQRGRDVTTSHLAGRRGRDQLDDRPVIRQ